MNSKQRAYLRKLAHDMEPIFQIGKAGVTPELVTSVDQALEKREMIKCTMLKNCFDEPRNVAETIAARSRSEVVMVMGRRFVLYRPNKDKPSIVLPK